MHSVRMGCHISSRRFVIFLNWAVQWLLPFDRSFGLTLPHVITLTRLNHPGHGQDSVVQQVAQPTEMMDAPAFG
jgi:hypothetical protein